MFVPILNIVAPDIFLHIELLFLTICLHLDLLDRVGQSVESALIALAAIFFLAHSAYLNNFHNATMTHFIPLCSRLTISYLYL